MDMYMARSAAPRARERKRQRRAAKWQRRHLRFFRGAGRARGGREGGPGVGVRVDSKKIQLPYIGLFSTQLERE